MNRLTDLEAFVATVELGSLTAAAQKLGRSLQSVSRSLAAIEQNLGTELIRRTTRHLHPTDAGQLFYKRLKAALADIEEAKILAMRERVEPTGLLRISSPAAYTRILPIIALFLETYPRIEIDLKLYSRFSDFNQANIDLAVRVGSVPDLALKAKLLVNWRRVFVASPAYLGKHGRPIHPNDLLLHQCIVRTSRPNGQIWPYTHKKRVETITVSGRFKASGGPEVVDAAILGLGIIIAPLWQVQPHIEKGVLDLILTRFEPPPIPVYAVWPPVRTLPARTRLFIDFLSKKLA